MLRVRDPLFVIRARKQWRSQRRGDANQPQISDVSVVQNFHNLRAWNEANRLAIEVKRLATGFPKADHGSLRNQMVRAAESIADNIAEGCGAATNAEFARFLDIAIKSSSELESQIERSHGYALIRAQERDSLATQVISIRKMTWGLRKKVLANV